MAKKLKKELTDFFIQALNGDSMIEVKNAHKIFQDGEGDFYFISDVFRISDNRDDSQNFLDELTTVFRNYGISYEKIIIRD